jgi:sigma-B regulation protein RsbQ
MPNSNPIIKNNVTITGNPNAAQTILFGHGFGTDQTAWKDVVQPFLSDYKVILYDMVGAGKSDMTAFSPNKYNTLHSYADDLVDLCITLNIENAIMVAHSVSGMASMLAAIKAPQYFSRMVFIGASPRYINDEGYTGGFTQEDLNNLFHQMETNYYAWISGFAPMVMSNEDKPELTEGFAKTLAEIRPDIAVSVARTIFQSDTRKMLHLLDKPTLLLHSEYDAAVPREVANYLHAHIRDSQLEIINATGHFPHMSAPKDVIHVIQRFIA